MIDQFVAPCHTTSSKQYVVICVDQEQGERTNSRINEMLVWLQEGLRGREDVEVAFVYESPALEVRPFQPLDRIYYKERCSEIRGSHSLLRLWCMGRVLLADTVREQGAARVRRRLILLTEGEITRRTAAAIAGMSVPEVEFEPYIIHLSERGRLNLLREYLTKHNGGWIRYDKTRPFPF